MMKRDIENQSDIKLLVDSFYNAVKCDETLAPVFAYVNWPMHLPKMYSFWGSMLLGEATYRGQPLVAHLGLKIDATHFEAWLAIWYKTIDELFIGDVANEAKMRGSAIAGVFQSRMGITIGK